jgi:predicted permease
MRQDVIYALRSLWRSPVFALAAIGTLALGIGVNSTIFTLANGALFRAMPGIGAPSELVRVSGVPRETGRSGGVSYPEFLDYREQTSEIFSNILAFAPTPFSLGGGGEPQRVRGHLVTGSYFATLGVAPAAGRTLQPSDDLPAAVPSAVISHRLWRDRFGKQIPTHPIVVNGRNVIVVGVAPDGFVGPELGQSADLWMPISALPILNPKQSTWLHERGTEWLRVIGRTRTGVSAQQTQTVISAIAARIEAEHPDTNEQRTAHASSASTGLRPSDRSELLPIAGLLLTVTGLVLVIACANVANLLLARGAGRAMELGIRAAVGASRWRIVRQLLVESALLSIAGAAGGLLLSFWASDLVHARLPELDFAGLQVAVDLRVLCFTAMLAAASACTFGLMPALSVTRTALVPRLRDTQAAGRRSRLQRVFVITQLSLSLVLLLAAGLSLRALQKASAIDLGFNADGLLTASYDLTLQNYSLDRRDAFRRELTRHIDSLPGVSSATITDLPPLSGTMWSTIVATADSGSRPSETRAYMSSVAPNYFQTLEIPVLRGRGIDTRDQRGTSAVVVVNEMLARRLWPEQDPLGRQIQIDDERAEVVGVVRDAKYDEATERPRPFLYRALAQHAQLDRETLIVRATGTGVTTAAVQAEIRALDSALPVFDVRAFATVLRDRADKQRGISALFAAFGLLALVLAALGLYGVMSYAVTRRTHEMGVRLALGATASQLIRLIAVEGFRLALSGVVVGLVLAYPLARALGALIFGIQIGDLLTLAAGCAVLVAVAMVAALLPARRASRMDPISALRTE